MTLFLASLAFFASGFAALVYQIVWQRLLVLPMGADVYSATIVVSAFMAGLGCGSLLGGHIADRLTARRSLLLFVGAELAVGAFGLGSRFVFYDWMYLQLGSAGLGASGMAALVFGSLLWPTFWMGMSLPLLGRAVARSITTSAHHVGMLYALNTIGAACGAFAATWVLLPNLGLATSLRVAGTLNAVAAVGAAILVPRVNETRAIDEIRVQTFGPTAGRRQWPFATWATLYAIAGFQALSLEIIWFRLLGVMLKSSAFTFGTLLTIYLAGVGLGAAAGSVVLRIVRDAGRAFLLAQAFIGLYAGFSMFVLVSALPSSTLLSPLWRYFGQSEPFDAVSGFAHIWGGQGGSQFVLLYLVLPVVIVGPPTIAMGASFPLLQKIALRDLEHLGRRVGRVLAANVAGSTAGAILTGWLGLTWLGTAGLLRTLTVLGGLFLAAAVMGGHRRATMGRVTLAFGVVVAIAAGAIALPGGGTLWARLHGGPAEWIVFAEDATGLSVLKAEPRRPGSANVFIEGIGQSWIPFGDIHSVLGALPAFLHPNPKEAAVIGLGSGDTVYSLAGRREISHITCIEIIRSQLTTLQVWANRTGYPALLDLLSDPRVELISGDGRIQLMRSGHNFDIIEADALRPTSAYSGNLYSVGYFTLLRSHLASGGIAVSWSPTSRVRDTFIEAFPHVLGFGNILVGSNEALTFDAEAVHRRLEAPAVQQYYRQAGIDIDKLLAPSLGAPPAVLGSGQEVHRRNADLNEDLFPRDEFGVSRPTE